MADGRHLEQSKIGHFAATASSISIKFGMLTQIHPSNRIGSKKTAV